MVRHRTKSERVRYKMSERETQYQKRGKQNGDLPTFQTDNDL